MKTIGIISDTHGFLDRKVFEHFRECDEVWHAGDIGTLEVANALEDFKPLRAVYGNVDDRDLQNRFPEDLFFDCEGLLVWITHIGGTPSRYNPRVKKLLNSRIPDIFVCGHSHILRVAKDPGHNGMLFINPGAAGNHGFHTIKTLIRLEVSAKKVTKMEAIELGRRGMIA